MKPLIGLIVGLSMSWTVDAQSSWYHCTFDFIENDIILEKIRLIEPSTADGLSHFKLLDKDGISFTRISPSGSASIHYIDFKKRIKGNLFDSQRSLSQLDQRIASSDKTLIVDHGDQQQIIQLKDDQATLIKSCFKIVDYAWINSDVIAIIEQDESQKTTCYLYTISTETQQTISVNPGRKIARISDDDIAFVDIFSNEYRYIKSFSISKQRATIIVKLPKTVDHFTLDGDANFYIAQDDQLLKYTKDVDVTWKPFFSFAPYKLFSIEDLYYIDNNRIIFSHEK